MRKKIFFFVLALAAAIVSAFNLNVVQNDTGDIRLQNVEVLSYGETGPTKTCVGIGPLDCPGVTTKVYIIIH